MYDRHRRPLRWSDDQRRYWESQRLAGRRDYCDNWASFAQNGYRHGEPQGRRAAPYRHNGYRVRAQPAVPGDAVPPAYNVDRPYPGPGGAYQRHHGG